MLAAFSLRRKEPPRHVRRNQKLLGEFQKMLQGDGFELEWPKLAPR